jgi:hypothetical protein
MEFIEGHRGAPWTFLMGLIRDFDHTRFHERPRGAPWRPMEFAEGARGAPINLVGPVVPQ